MLPDTFTSHLDVFTLLLFSEERLNKLRQSLLSIHNMFRPNQHVEKRMWQRYQFSHFWHFLN